MRQIFLDTETTGLSPENGDRIVEIGCVELVNRKLTGNNLHFYLNPERDSHEDALKVHGISNEFLKDKPKFGEIADEFDDGVEAFVWITEDKARAKATLHIEDLADELKVDIDKADFEDVDTIGGLMAQKLGRVPIAGSTISIAGWTITSERPVGRRRKISSVIIERIKDVAPEDHE